MTCYVDFFMILLLIMSFFLNQFQVTSAFDGTRMSKWEEPNGAKGMFYLLWAINMPSCKSGNKLKMNIYNSTYNSVYGASFFPMFMQYTI